MIFCKKCEYAIRALVDLAQTQSRTGAREISQRQNVPYHFGAKILQELKVKGFLRSARGVGGGFALARPADQVYLMEVVVALDCHHWLHQCIYGLADCADGNPCPLHLGWKPIRGQIEHYLNKHSIADLARRLGDGEKPAGGWLDYRGLPGAIRSEGSKFRGPQSAAT